MVSVKRQQPPTRLITLHTEYSLPRHIACDIVHNVHQPQWFTGIHDSQLSLLWSKHNDSANMGTIVSSAVLASYPVIIQSSWRVFAAWLAAQLIRRWVVFIIVVIALWTWPFHTTPPIMTTWPWSVTPFIPKIKHTNINLRSLLRNKYGNNCSA
jgi:hypothetical protein